MSTVTQPATSLQVISSDLILPEDLRYLGAFRLPASGERPETFAYGGNAMTYFPSGDLSGPDDGFPGSLFIMGHDRLPYGEMPDGNQVAELSIPAPMLFTDIASLPTTAFLQPFDDVAAGHFTSLEEIPRVGLAFLDTPTTGPLLHITWGAHFQEDGAAAPSHGWVATVLDNPDFKGEWYLDAPSLYSVNGYLFPIPQEWADPYFNGIRLASGRYRDGGWSGMGPSLYAYQPWLADGSPVPNGSTLATIPLLQYDSSFTSEDFSHALTGYSHADEWEGGAWLADDDGRSAVIFAGTKATGAKTWYGWQHPAGPEFPCIETELRDEFVTCRLADGTPCPSEDLSGCTGHNDYRGWWSSEFQAQILFYDPADLARVANGTMEAWQPQPYAVMTIDDVLYHNPDNVETNMLGNGVQRRARIGDIAFDTANGTLYILELFADGAQPVVHVWQIAPGNP
ncbi:MAG: hypothetical protein HPY85_00360 [Anaerolineae bacterium]|nr:hypothetical protein [Anaerolineae bacterium]